MTSFFFRSLACVSLLALLGAGCGRSASHVPEQTATPSPASTSVAAIPSLADCLNLYYPLRAGSAITYRMKAVGLEAPVTIRVLEHTTETVKLEYSFAVQDRVATITNELACENGTIKGKGYFDFAQAFSGLDLTYDTISMEGEILPNDLTVGREWNLATEVEMHTSNPQMKAILDGRRQKTLVTSKVIGEEDVTVPAGTFRALKIEQMISLESSVAGVPSETVGHAWYVKDVGLVKSEHRAGKVVSSMEATEIVH
jgi:hypothetical protein